MRSFAKFLEDFCFIRLFSLDEYGKFGYNNIVISIIYHFRGVSMSNKPIQNSERIHNAFIGFRRENLLSCFAALCQTNGMTRAELALATGLSIMTTGKIADAMTEAGILTEQKLPAPGAGRRPGTLHFQTTPMFLVLNLSSRRFRAILLSPDMSFTEVCVHDYNDIFPFDDNLLIFLNAVRRSCDTSEDAIPYLAVITSPEDDKRQSITRTLSVSPRSTEHMLHIVCKILRRECNLVIDEIMAAQEYFHSLSTYQNAECGVFISLSDMMYAAVWMRGNLLSPRICRIGELLLPQQRRIADALAEALCTEESILPTAYAISTLESFFTPDLVILESTRFRLDQEFLEGVYRDMRPLLPANSRIIDLELSPAKPSAAVCGCACELRRKWFFDVSGLNNQSCE